MGFSSSIDGLFADEARERGRALFRADRVRIRAVIEDRIDVTVRPGMGSGVSPGTGHGPPGIASPPPAASVTFRLHEGRIDVGCTCSTFARDDLPCEHIYAAALLLDRLPRFQGGPAAEPNACRTRRHAFVRGGSLGTWEAAPGATPGIPGPAARPGARPTATPSARPTVGPPTWQATFEALERHLEPPSRPPAARDSLEYLLEPREAGAGVAGGGSPAGGDGATGGAALRLRVRRRLRDGRSSVPSPWFPRHEAIARLADPVDRRIAGRLAGGVAGPAPWSTHPESVWGNVLHLTPDLCAELLPDMARTGRLWLRPGTSDTEIGPLEWDDGPPWAPRLRVDPSGSSPHAASPPAAAPARTASEGSGAEPAPSSSGWRLHLVLARGDEELSSKEADAILGAGFVIARGRVARLELDGGPGWVSFFRRHRAVRVPAQDIEAALGRLWRIPGAPAVALPETRRLIEVRSDPRPAVRIRPPARKAGAGRRLRVELSFLYGDARIRSREPGDAVPDFSRRELVVRSRRAEEAAMGRLRALGFATPRNVPSVRPPEEHDLELAGRRLPGVVRSLVAEGWHVEADDKVYRKAGTPRVSVSSGIDWLDLDVEVTFDGGQVVRLPALLEALRRREKLVVLGDGALGLLPEEWLARHGLFVSTGRVESGRLRFRPSQIPLIEDVIGEAGSVALDPTLARFRESIREFAEVRPVDEPVGFRGSLRPYQKVGLGWMRFLRDLGLGGCLADDMGLGKTVEVLALLQGLREERRSAAGPDAPAGRMGEAEGHASLVVVPRTLVFNWLEEAARFAPDLRVLDHSLANRALDTGRFDEYDVVLTTYGILRNDVSFLKAYPFEYAILDESQAIKNSKCATAVAARELRASCRLALSGTPIENHLGELWSLFEFLNPGLLGQASAFDAAVRSPSLLDPEARKRVKEALRPYILRRTKEQVAPELPEKVEQTLFCDLEPADRRMYAEIRDDYRARILRNAAGPAGEGGDSGGASGSALVLEALLRLRQVACHPGLVDPTLVGRSSAKLSILRERLDEVVAEGHKALVFSQFTSLLAIVRQDLEAREIPHEYLDGQTTDRKTPVDRFQSEPGGRVFLISLKAGGLGLNLTAADYVYILDPWWNPAAESQAIDRAHRIGRAGPVIACRIIARDTVEEKVLELQKSKRELAEAIIDEQNSLLRGITREDLELLLS